MRKKQRNLAWSIFMLGILFIVILLWHVPKRITTFSKLAKIQALFFAKIPQRKISDVKVHDKRKHQTNRYVVKNIQIMKDNHYVHTSLPIATLPNSKRLRPKTVAFTSDVSVRATTSHLHAITTHLRETTRQFRASPTHMRANTSQNRASKTKDRARILRIRAGLAQSPTVNVPNYSVPLASGMSTLNNDAKSSPSGATSHNHSELRTSIELKARRTTSSANQRSRVVILAHGRSGSSFLGGIFNAHSDVFFIYEPLLTLQKYFVNISSDSYLHKVEEVLHSIMNCNFKDNQYLKYLSKFDRHRSMSSPLVSTPLCNVSQYEAINFQENRKWRRCVKKIPAHALNNLCRKKRHVAIKVLAARLTTADFSWLLRVSGTSSSPVRILYLVRDPRAMHFSWYNVGWIAPRAQRKESLENGLAESKVKKYCDRTEEHLRSITRHAEHIQVIRFEDLATNPEAFISRLFSSLRIRPSEDISRWLQEKNHAQVKRLNYFSLFRQTKAVITAWQKNIPTKLVSIVEAKCHRIMKYLGYLPTNGSKTLLRNVQKPLFSDEWGTQQL